MYLTVFFGFLENVNHVYLMQGIAVLAIAVFILFVLNALGLLKKKQ